MGNIELYKISKNEQNQLINKKVICMCPKMYDPLDLGNQLRNPKFFYQSMATYNLHVLAKFKKNLFRRFLEFKGGFSNFRPTFFRIHSTGANQIQLISYDLY
jgi:hypothetical protein